MDFRFIVDGGRRKTKKITIAGWAPHKLAKDGGGEFIRSEYHYSKKGLQPTLDVQGKCFCKLQSKVNPSQTNQATATKKKHKYYGIITTALPVKTSNFMISFTISITSFFFF